MPNVFRLTTALLFLVNVSACREIIDAPVDSGSADGGMDMEVDAGPCGVCSGNLVCIEGADAGAMCGCENDDNCPASGNTACDTETHQCVQCTEDADCMLAGNSHCGDDHTCEPCTESAQCEHIAGANVCSTSGEHLGCVECTHDEQGVCTDAGEFCGTLTNECSGRAPGGQDLCEECLSDVDCMEGQLCVPMTFGVDDRFVGHYCLYMQNADGAGAPNGTCTTMRAYANAQTLASLDGSAPTAVCAPIATTTCGALADYRTAACSGEGAAGDSECGLDGADDGFCRMVDALTNQCTTPCGAEIDCKAGATCNGSGRCVW